MEFDKIEGGTKRLFTLTASLAFDGAPSFAFYNHSGTLVHSYTATQSSTTAYFVFADIPNTPGYCYYEWIYGQSSRDLAMKGIFEIVTTTVAESDLYCNANDVRNLYKPLSRSDMRNNEIDEFIQGVMNEIDAKVCHVYSTPFKTGVNSLPPIIETITKNLALVDIMERQGGDVPEWVERRDERFRGMLDGIAARSIFLTLSGGNLLTPSMASQAGQADHNLEDYVPTMNMLGPEYQRIDPDRIDDEYDNL